MNRRKVAPNRADLALLFRSGSRKGLVAPWVLPSRSRLAPKTTSTTFVAPAASPVFEQLLAKDAFGAAGRRTTEGGPRTADHGRRTTAFQPET